ncbi:MAG: (2Fe-2S)-binding protein [Myxococcota bacterium]
MKKDVTFELDGYRITATVASHHRLLDLLRNEIGQTGTKEGCGEGECGACTVIVDGRAVNACLFPAPEIEGRKVLTVQGLLLGGRTLSPIQRAFVEMGGVQCGFCTPGMIMTAVALLDANPDPSDDEIRKALVGNLCRCTGYVQIVDSIKRGAALLREATGNGAAA